MENEREPLLGGFRDVFEFLVKKSYVISDDAILHIFIDILEKYSSKEGNSFISSSGVLEFLENVGKETRHHDTSVVVFGLNVCAWLGADEGRFQEWSETVKGFVSQFVAQVQVSWKQNVSVVTAFYDCLSKMTKHKHGLEWVCLEYKGNLVQPGVLKEKHIRLIWGSTLRFRVKHSTDIAIKACLYKMTWPAGYVNLREHLVTYTARTWDRDCSCSGGHCKLTSLPKEIQDDFQLDGVLCHAFIPDCFDLLEAGSSVFLEKSVIDYLANLARLPEHCDFEEELGRIHRDIADRICQAIHKHVTPGSDGVMLNQRWSVTTTVLKLSDKLLQSQLAISDHLVTSEDLVTDVMAILHRSKGPETEICLRILEMLAQQRQVRGNIHQHWECSGTMELAERLWRGGEVIKSLKLVARVYTIMKSADQCHHMLVAPLHLVACKGNNPEWTNILRSQNFSRSKLLDILCTSLSCITRTKLSEPRLVQAVFETTVNSGADMSSIAKNSRRIQRNCLQYFLDNTGLVDSEETELLLNTTVQIVKQTDIDPVSKPWPNRSYGQTVQTLIRQLHQELSDLGLHCLQKAYTMLLRYETFSLCIRCLQSNLPLLVQSTQCTSLSADLANILQRHLCSIQWELRDTTIEFLGQVVQEYKDRDSVLTWLKTNGLHTQIWHCVRDGESYVRASAISALWHVYSCHPLWTGLLHGLGHTEETAVGVIVSILASDSEAFARRSAARFLSSYLKTKLSTDSMWKQSSQVLQILLKATEDFDWEVKLCALGFIDSIIEDQFPATVPVALPEYAKEVMQSSDGICERQSDRNTGSSNEIQAVYKLYCAGVLSSLLNTLDDYDEKVCEKACEVVTSYKEKLCKVFGNLCVTREDIQDMCNIALSHNGIGEMNKEVTNDCEHKPKHLKPDPEVAHSIENVGRTSLIKDFVTTVDAIVSFDSVEYRMRFESQSDYYSNPLSLIQDILSYGDKDEEDNLVDCY